MGIVTAIEKSLVSHSLLEQVGFSHLVGNQDLISDAVGKFESGKPFTNERALTIDDFLCDVTQMWKFDYSVDYTFGGSHTLHMHAFPLVNLPVRWLHDKFWPGL